MKIDKKHRTLILFYRPLITHYRPHITNRLFPHLDKRQKSIKFANEISF